MFYFLKHLFILFIYLFIRVKDSDELLEKSCIGEQVEIDEDDREMDQEWSDEALAWIQDENVRVEAMVRLPPPRIQLPDVRDDEEIDKQVSQVSQENFVAVSNISTQTSLDALSDLEHNMSSLEIRTPFERAASLRELAMTPRQSSEEAATHVAAVLREAKEKRAKKQKSAVDSSEKKTYNLRNRKLN